MRNTTPAVSVVMPVFNRQRYVGEAIESVLGQTFNDLELILVDDGSTDRSLRICRQYARRDPRVHVMTQENRGCYAARNVALCESRGRYTTIVDSDDVCVADRLARQVAFLDANPDCVAVGGQVRFTDPFGVPTQLVVCPEDHDAIDTRHLRGEPGGLIHGAATCRTDAMRAIDGYHEMRSSADYDLFLRLAEVGRLANLPGQPVVHVRTHLQSISSKRRLEQIGLASRFANDARQRRGLEPLPFHVVEADHPAILAPVEQVRSWALHAIEADNRAIARRHALALLRLAPHQRDSSRMRRPGRCSDDPRKPHPPKAQPARHASSRLRADARL